MILTLKIPKSEMAALVSEIQAAGNAVQWLDSNRIWSDNSFIIKDTVKFLKSKKIEFTKERS